MLQTVVKLCRVRAAAAAAAAAARSHRYLRADPDPPQLIFHRIFAMIFLLSALFEQPPTNSHRSAFSLFPPQLRALTFLPVEAAAASARVPKLAFMAVEKHLLPQTFSPDRKSSV